MVGPAVATTITTAAGGEVRDTRAWEPAMGRWWVVRRPVESELTVNRCEPELMALKPLGQGTLTGKVWEGDVDRNGSGSTGTLVANAGR